MGMRSFDGWSANGIGTIVTALPVALSTTRALVNVRIPENARLHSIEARVNTIVGAASIIAHVWRDSGGDNLFYSGGSQTFVVGTTTASDGGATWAVNRDHHPDGAASSAAARTGWPQDRYVNLWISLELNAGTANLDGFVVNWLG